MKNIVWIVALFSFAIANGQKKKVTTAKKTNNMVTLKKSSPVLMTPIDSFSYAIGLEGASYYKTQGATQINSEAVKKAFDDIYNNRPPQMTPEQCNSTIQQRLQVYTAAKSGKVKEEGKKFLVENKKRPGVIQLPNGLQYEIIKAGTGEKPKVTDTVKAHYIGTLVNGKEFDNSYTRGTPLQIPVSGVIPGWVQALQMMPVGSKWKLFIPSDLAYGDRGAGNGAIPGGATLIFVIELIEIVGKK